MPHDAFSENYLTLKARVHDTPQEPGVYIMQDQENRIIYVGKARLLRNRLHSYFSSGKDIKTATLMRHVHSIETIILSNEYEALLLENTLIKQHSPKYNINLKDGKSYPVIRITAEDFPRVFKTRHIIEDNSRYFGPFPQVQAVDTMLDLTDKLFPLRKCKSSWNQIRNRKSPCMYYHIRRCEAPCCGKISPQDYARHVDQIVKLLSGETGTLIRELGVLMREAAEALKFERAAELRNAIRAIQDLSEANRVVDFDPQGRDYIAWAAEGVLATYTVFSMRGGKMTGRELFRTRSAADERESLETFAASFYSPERPPPQEIYLAYAASPAAGPPLPEALFQWFQKQFGYAPRIILAQDTHHRAVLAMARQNAWEDLRRRLKERGAGPALDELRQVLSLKQRPERIEGFDVAQLDGTHPVASLIAFRNGVPDRKNYRHFKLRETVGVVDDFAALREAVRRRYSRIIREGQEPPDLILIDGGIGQVNTAKGVLDELGLDCDVVGLAKREEELWLPHARSPVRLSRQSEALKVLQFVRDETHRFATSFNQRLRSKDLCFGILESVEGIGPKRASAIMQAYGSLEQIADAPAGALAEAAGMGASAARSVKAAVKLALEDRDRQLPRHASPQAADSGRSAGIGASLAAEAGQPSGTDSGSASGYAD